MRKTSTAAAALVALGLLLSLCVGSASADLAYEHEGLIDGVAPPGTTSPAVGFGEGGPTDLAVNQTTHDLYVVDDNHDVIDVFSAAGVFVRQISGATTPAGKVTLTAIAIDNSGGLGAGYLYAADSLNNVVNVYNPLGAYQGQLKGTGTPPGSFDNPQGVAVGPAGEVFVADNGHGVFAKFVPSAALVKDSDYASQFGDPEAPPDQIAVDSDGNLYNAAFFNIFGKFGPTGTYLGNPKPDLYYASDVAFDYSRDEILFDQHYYGVTVTDSTGANRYTIGAGASAGVAVDETTGRVYLTNTGYWVDYYKRVELATATSGSASGVTDTTATISGRVERKLGGDIVECKVEYGSDTDYTKSAPCDAPTPYSSDQDVTSHLTDLVPGVTYHYRLVARNSQGTAVGVDRTFTTFQPPLIESVTAANIFETTADLRATINPKGSETTYRFEYGVTDSYGQVAPIPDESIGAGVDGENVVLHLTDLEPSQYHFRVVASNEFGTRVSADQTFTFFPPDCPNSHVRQETKTAYLPDCRAYELASAETTNGTSIFPGGGPTSPYATNPSRVAYSGDFSTIPGTGEPSNTIGDLYVATRTNTGWITKYVGRPASQVLASTGPPGRVEEGPDKSQVNVFTNLAMDRFAQWDVTSPILLTATSNSAYVTDEEGNYKGTLPTSYEETPGAAAGLACPTTPATGSQCAGAISASQDMSHFVFSSSRFDYAEGGLTSVPGSAYDNDVEANTVKLISRLPNGEDIPSEGGVGRTGESINFPAISKDGSHILMAALYPAGVHLYMHAGGITRDVTGDHPSTFAGMTDDGRTVYFSSADQVTADDEDTSVDLFMWTEQTGEVVRISQGSDGAGNSDKCAPTNEWTQKCNIGLISFDEFARGSAGIGGNGHSDSTVARNSGDIYFYSPEQLDADRGIRNLRNLYVYRNGEVQHVAALQTGGYCILVSLSPEPQYACSSGPVGRMQMTPDGRKVAFITPTKLTAYENGGYAEMYLYDAVTRETICVSCIPSGAPPTAAVNGSQNGLFITDDGRPFFSTADPLTARDTNKGVDVYEYVEGRAQLISPGVGDSTRPLDQAGLAFRAGPGLVGVSANGTDAFFATYEKLVGQDRNGDELKVYDARVSGGFPFTPPPPPCPSADECHGDASRAPASAEVGTGAYLGEEPVREAKQGKKRSKKGKRLKKACKGRKSKTPKCKRGKRHPSPIVRSGRDGRR